MKKLVITLALVLTASTIFAQDETRNKWAHFETNHFWDNWEISVGAGVQTVLNSKAKTNGVSFNKGDFGDRLGFALDANVTKWISPVFGVRAGYIGLNTKDFFLPVGAENVDDNYIENKNNFYTIHADMLFNLTNWICGYKSDRFFNATAFAGIGYGESKNADAPDGESFNDEWTLPVGFLFNFRLCSAFAIQLEARDIMVRNNFLNDGYAEGCPGAQETPRVSHIVSLTAGLTYKFPNKTVEGQGRLKRGFTSYTPIDMSAYVDKDAYNNLEREYNDAKKQSEEYQKQLDRYKKALDAETRAKNEALANAGKGTINGDVMLGIFFTIGSAEVSDANTENINFMASLMNANKSVKYTVTGYADKETGSEARNNILSQERAEAVRDALVKAGVDSNQIKVDYRGCKVQPFEGKGYLNRVAIIN